MAPGTRNLHPRLGSEECRPVRRPLVADHPLSPDRRGPPIWINEALFLRPSRVRIPHYGRKSRKRAPRFEFTPNLAAGLLKSPQKKASAPALRVAKTGTSNPQRSAALIGLYSAADRGEIAKSRRESAPRLSERHIRSSSYRLWPPS